MIEVAIQTVLGIVYLLVQIFFFDLIRIEGWAYPHIAPIWILFLPVTTNRYLLYSSAFIFGIALDITLLPLGLQSICLMALCVARNPWIRLISPQITSLKTDGINFQAQSYLWKLLYVLPLLGFYSLLYQILYQFSWARFSSILIQSAGGSLFSMIISSLILLFFYNPDVGRK
ncbi:MAG: hypothetical protein LC115_03150 [Bacteroidia bacterium]|nr:hypothetical protein [Bacteroidia bacterium]